MKEPYILDMPANKYISIASNDLKRKHLNTNLYFPH